MDKKIRDQLTDFARQLKGPLGNIPLDRAIKGDLELFKALRNTGATWTQIAKALTSAGALRPDGSPISADHLRSAVSRQLHKKVIDTNSAKPAATANQTARSSPASPQKTNAAAPSEKKSVGKTVKTDIAKTPLDENETGHRSNASILEKLNRTKQLRDT